MGLVSQFVNAMNEAAENLVLTVQMTPFDGTPRPGQMCLVQVASMPLVSDLAACRISRVHGPMRPSTQSARRFTKTGAAVCISWPMNAADCFDGLCHRFGTARITNAIRNRVLSNITRRTLAPTPAGVA